MKNNYLVFCIEADSNSRSDEYYIRYVLSHYYSNYVNFKVDFVYMGGKTNYNKNYVLNQIRKIKSVVDRNKKYNDYETVILYCIDLDCLTSENIRLNTSIEKYCIDNNYELIKFKDTIELVFWKKSISNSEKVKYAKRYKNSIEAANLNESKLRSSLPGNKSSNLLLILDKYIKQEED